MTMTVTTDDKATAFQIARQLEITVPKVMKNKNNGLLNASKMKMLHRGKYT